MQSSPSKLSQPERGSMKNYQNLYYVLNKSVFVITNLEKHLYIERINSDIVYKVSHYC